LSKIIQDWYLIQPELEKHYSFRLVNNQVYLKYLFNFRILLTPNGLKVKMISVLNGLCVEKGFTSAPKPELSLPHLTKSEY